MENSTGHTDTQVTSKSSGHWASQWYSGKRVLVTGGTSGIGAGITQGFLEAGAEVIATGVSQAEIDKVGDALTPADRRVLDVRDGPAVKALVGELGVLDIVVNCAGIIRRIDEFEPSVFEDVIDTNLTEPCGSAWRRGRSWPGLRDPS